MPIRLGVVGLLAAVMLLGAAGCASDDAPTSDVPLKIGLLLDFSGSPETSASRQRGFELAIAQVNANGGVLGRPVESIAADAPRDLDVALESARRFVEDEGVHAIVGPNSSAASLPIAEQVTGPAGIPTISPSATAPRLADAADDDFFFRTALSDTAQGPILAQLARDRGFTNVGLTFRDDPYGRGLAAAFEAAWTGTIISVSVDTVETSYLAALQETASAGAEALVVIDFGTAAQAIVQEAIDAGIYDQFLFADAAKRVRIVEEIGGEHLGGMYGTAGSPPPPSEVGREWDAAFAELYGDQPILTYVKETYDAAMAIMLAAEAAGSVDGTAIRDKLRAIATPPGETVHATPQGIADALRLLREGEEINFEGAGGTLDWDANGDLLRGHIGIWRFTPDETIEEVEVLEVRY